MVYPDTGWKLLLSTLLVLILGSASQAAERQINIVPGPSAPQERTALVFGNAAYDNSPLPNPVNDASDMASALRQMGFAVIEQRNASLRTMMEALETFATQLRQSKVGLFYFAGHGMQINGENYLIPLGARINREQDVPFEALPVGRVLGVMEKAGTTTNIIILDACRNNPYARSFRSGQQGLAAVQAINGSLIAYATAPGSVAADGKERNGVYTAHLLRNMRVPGVPIEQVMKNVRIGVQQDTNNQQTPWESSSLTRDFTFVSSGAQASVPASTPAPTSPAPAGPVASLEPTPPASSPSAASIPSSTPSSPRQGGEPVTADGLAIIRQRQVQAARQQAIQEARTKALQQFIEQQIGTTTASQRYAELDRQIYAEGERYILDAQPLKEWQEGNKFQVTVEVLLDTGKISQTLTALGLTARKGGTQSARIMVLIAETAGNRTLRDSASETAMVEELLKHGFRVVAVEHSPVLRTSSQGQQVLAGDTRTLRQIGRQYGAELLIIGSASSQVAMAGRELGGLVSARAHLDAKAVRVETTDIVTAGGHDASGLDITSESAGKKALAEVGRQWVEQHLNTLLQWK